MGAGRPKLFNTVEELEDRINEFYEYCELKEKPLTFERLAVFLGIDRKTIYNYSQKDEFFPTIKAVKERILADIMDRGLTNQINSTFGIFCLKNYGYTDKQEVTSVNQNINANVNLDALSDEQIDKILESE